jgi:hypothetical protein
VKDVVSDALSELRGQGALDPERKAAIRRRVLATSMKRRKTVRWMLPMVAMFAVASAWAAATHPHSFPPLGEAPGQPSTSAPIVTTLAKPPKTDPIAEASAVEPVRPVAELQVPQSVETAGRLPESHPSEGRAAVAPLSAPARPDRPVAPPSDTERRALVAYREAERLQFTESNCAAALVAWDRFLPLAGSSPLAFDARYDRALCLLHLGKTAEARAALTPFASAAPGSYRQAEAQSLLDSLR